MIGIRLMGGLGNMMFQIATGESWRAGGYPVVYTNMDENLFYIANNYNPIRHSEEYKTMFAGFEWNKHKPPVNTRMNKVNVPFTYTPIEPKDNTEYVGYFQSEKNFPDFTLVESLFRPREHVLGGLYPVGQNSCSIHVRRADYLNLQRYHIVLGVDYYKRAIDIMKEIGVVSFCVFSDDLDWCKDNLKGDQFKFYDVREYTALYMMSLCDHNIIANSSLSWWGAWLGCREDRTVIAPVNWFGKDGADDRDLVPDRWIRI